MAQKALGIVLILILALCSSFSGLALGQSEYSLGLEGKTWDHSVINVLILTPQNASWWNPHYVPDALNAMNEWNDALVDFASNYSAYAYLSGVRFVASVSNASESGFDVYVYWTENLPTSGGADVLGTTLTYSESNGIIVNCTVSMSSKDQFGLGISETDMQNGVLHEMGHTLGLGHTSVSNDIMSPAVVLGNPVRSVSTLDEYGVASAFNWLQKSPQFDLGNWQGEDSVTLPSTIPYRYSPISSENMPPQSVLGFLNGLLQTLLKDATQTIISPVFFLVTIFLGVLLLLIAVLLVIGRRGRQTNSEFKSRQS